MKKSPFVMLLLNLIVAFARFLPRHAFSLFVMVALFALFAFNAQPVFAEPGLTVYSVTTSTYPADNVHTGALTAGIANWANIHKIVITNDDVTVAQTVTFYTFSTSTITATAAWSIDLDSTTAVGYNGVYEFDFPIEARSWKVRNVIIRKSGTGSAIKVTAFYH